MTKKKLLETIEKINKSDQPRIEQREDRKEVQKQSKQKSTALQDLITKFLHKV